MRRVCIQWPTLGPYHVARLRATHALFAQRGVEVIALETAASDSVSAWSRDTGFTPFRREQVFPGRAFSELAPSVMQTGIMSALDRLDPDAVAINSYSFPDAQACLYWCRAHRRAAIVVTDSKEDDVPRTSWREYLKKRVVQQFDAALVGGTPHRAYITKLGIPEHKIFLGCDVVDNEFFRTRAEEVRRDPGPSRGLPGLTEPSSFFLASSRFVPRKNVDGLLLAYKLYRSKTVEPLRLVILGDGPQRTHLERLVSTHEIRGVTFAGQRSYEELGAYYGLAAAFVHPALTDQWALVVNEAMAAGLPVLVSTGAGCAQDLVVAGENGFVFAPHHTTQLAELLARIGSCETDRQRMGRASQEIIAPWSLERFAASLWNAFQAGSTTADRHFDLAAQSILRMLQIAAQESNSFHAIRD